MKDLFAISVQKNTHTHVKNINQKRVSLSVKNGEQSSIVIIPEYHEEPEESTMAADPCLSKPHLGPDLQYTI